MDDGREIAVKKLSHSSTQGAKEFTNEARLLARVQHRNVVNLLGYCVHMDEKLLVYEFVTHESLDKLLFSKFSVTFCYFPLLTFFFFFFFLSFALTRRSLFKIEMKLKEVLCLGSKFMANNSRVGCCSPIIFLFLHV